MADRDELRTLAQRVMALAGPDRETDALIWVAMSDMENARVIYGKGSRWFLKPGVGRIPVAVACGRGTKPSLFMHTVRYTSSLNAAMTLGRQFLLVAMSDIAADGLPGVCLCSDTSTSPPKEHWGIALGGASGPREQVLARCYTAAALLALAEQVPE